MPLASQRFELFQSIFPQLEIRLCRLKPSDRVSCFDARDSQQGFKHIALQFRDWLVLIDKLAFLHENRINRA